MKQKCKQNKLKTPPNATKLQQSILHIHIHVTHKELIKSLPPIYPTAWRTLIAPLEVIPRLSKRLVSASYILFFFLSSEKNTHSSFPYSGLRVQLPFLYFLHLHKKYMSEVCVCQCLLLVPCTKSQILTMAHME